MCDSAEKKSILFLGRPGVGKTTALRDVARYASTDLGHKVMIVDGSNEIAGDGDVPHACVGRSGRLQVPHGGSQYSVMVCIGLIVVKALSQVWNCCSMLSTVTCIEAYVYVCYMWLIHMLITSTIGNHYVDVHCSLKQCRTMHLKSS